ncbi:MAG: hypothetical protein QOE30_1245 [Mycobacterium sp.]|uniref:hypothetical protein n=1 Tax=Mycobacterium sp. TaxID=1785 RepID=UPI0028B369BB|nr:hypothetical protein [Mycobacterium sp.]MDT5115506.1 hypothetical protein [Mycobacterium sp.]
MDEQGAVGFPFAVREILSAAVSQAELDEVLATYGVTLGSLAGRDEQDHYWCAQLAQPVKRRIDDIDDPHLDSTYVGIDDDGAFAWTHYVALRPHDGTFGPGVQRAVADFAYVVDASLGAGTVFDSTKVDWVATVVVDSRGPDPAPNPRPLMTDEEEPWSPPADRAEPPPQPSPSPPPQLREPPAFSSEQFGRALDGVIATLASLTGTLVSEAPRPTEVKARKHSHYQGKGPSYSLDGSEMRYHTADPVHGLLWRSTTDPDEALYWIANDVARSMAWSWARRTPSAHVMDPFNLRWLLAVPLWQTLMTALDVRWAGRTRVEIAEIRREAQHRGPTPPTMS